MCLVMAASLYSVQSIKSEVFTLQALLDSLGGKKTQFRFGDKKDFIVLSAEFIQVGHWLPPRGIVLSASEKTTKDKLGPKISCVLEKLRPNVVLTQAPE